MDWFLYDIGLRHERVNMIFTMKDLNRRFSNKTDYLKYGESIELSKKTLPVWWDHQVDFTG